MRDRRRRRSFARQWLTVETSQGLLARGAHCEVRHGVRHAYVRLVIEASDRGAKERIGKELTKRISGSSPQSRIVNELERGLRVDRHIVPDAVGGIE